MSKKTFFANAERELYSLNEIIDRKIIKGESYRREAIRHKFLLSQLGSTTRVQTLLFGKSPGFIGNLFL